MAATDLPAHVRDLLRPDAYPHAPAQVELVQTHISYVFLAGDEVYKLKKPVDLGFVDFRTIESRRTACEAEVRLNRRGCAETYYGVEPVTLRDGRHRIGSDGEAVDYAVHMRRLPAGRMMDRLLEQDAVSFDMIGRLVARIVELHRGAETDDRIAAIGGYEGITANWRETIDSLAPFAGRTLSASRYERLRHFGEAFLLREEGLLRSRAAGGRVRDCHGDLRSDAVCFDGAVPGGICLYDCIEFNDAYRYIDTGNDVAFLAMDLDYRGRPDLSDLLIGLYTAAIGDRELPLLLPFYKCYRACVRGKVESLLLDQPEVSRAQKAAGRRRAQAYFRLAQSYTRPSTGSGRARAQDAARTRDRAGNIVLVMGPSGSGKSVLAGALASRTGAVLLSTDMLRRSLGESSPAGRTAAIDAAAYSPEARRRVYDELLRLMREYVAAGRSVVLDGTFVEAEQRAPVVELARELRARLLAVECVAPDAVVRERQQRRQSEVWTTSEGRYEVYEAQKARYEPPSEIEHRLSIDTMRSIWEQIEAVVGARGAGQ